MLTDDDLTRQLGAALHATSDDLTYNGRVPTARHTPSTRWLTVPALAAAAALVLIPSAGDGDRSGSQPPQAGPATTDPAPKLVTERVRVAGFTLSYQREAGGTVPVGVMLGALTVPDGFREVDLEGSTRAWAGVHAASGDSIVYVQPAISEGGGLVAMVSPTWTQERLVDLLREGIASN